jgi:hypothetical protein
MAAAIATSTSAHARQLPALDGLRVRVTAPLLGLEHHVGSITRVDGDSIWLANGASAPTSLSISQVTLLEVGRRSSHVGPGFVLGLIAGAAVGFALTDMNDCAACEGGHAGAPPAAVGAIAGSALGALIGLTLSIDRWRPVLRATPLGPRG